MADNIDVTPGTGLKVATDEVADGSHVQIIKLAIATDGIKTLIPADSGGLLVNLGTNNDVVEASAADIKTAVEALDNAVDGNYLNVNLNLAGTDITAGAGAVAAGTPRVTHASDDPTVTALQLIDNAVDGNYLNVNHNIAGTDVAAGAGVVNAQTQRVTHASDDPVTTAVQLIDNAVSGAGFNITQLAGAAVPIGAGTEAAALRVTVATDSTGVLSVDDNGGALTVDGTVTANLSATDNDVLDTIDAAIDAINAKLVTGTDIGDVTINNAAGAAAVNIQDGGNSITVDGTVAISSANASGITHSVTNQAETVASALVTCLTYRELTIYFNITAITGTWRIDVRAYDPDDVQYYELFRSAEYTATGKTRITFPIADNKFDVNLVEVASGAITCSIRHLLKS